MQFKKYANISDLPGFRGQVTYKSYKSIEKHRQQADNKPNKSGWIRLLLGYVQCGGAMSALYYGLPKRYAAFTIYNFGSLISLVLPRCEIVIIVDPGIDMLGAGQNRILILQTRCFKVKQACDTEPFRIDQNRGKVI